MLFRRKQAKMRQFDLAQQLGVTEQTISNFETNRRKPSISQAVDIARILNCDPADIFPEMFKMESK